MPGYEINTSHIKAIKSTYSARKGSKTTSLKGMNKFPEAELEAIQENAIDVSRQIEQTTEESHQQRSRGPIAKHAQSQSAKAGSSQKRTRREPKAKIPSRGILISEIEPESAYVDPDEESSVQLRPMSHRARGSKVATVEELLEEGEVTWSEPVLAPTTTESVPLTSFQGQEESTNPKDMRPSSPVEMIPSMGMSEQSRLLDSWLLDL